MSCTSLFCHVTHAALTQTAVRVRYRIGSVTVSLFLLRFHTVGEDWLYNMSVPEIHMYGRTVYRVDDPDWDTMITKYGPIGNDADG